MLAKDPSYLEVIKSYQDQDFGNTGNRFWSFPPYEKGELERSVSPNRGTASSIDDETLEDYSKFPDPHNHLIGFMCSKRTSRFSPHKIKYGKGRKESSNASSRTSSKVSKKSAGSTY